MPITTHLHLLMLVFVAACIFFALDAGRRCKRAGKLREMSRSLGCVLLALWTVYDIYYLLPANFNWKVSLPLQVCDILGLAAGLALLADYRLWRAFLYSSALALATQAVITPTGNQDPASVRFWLYWTLHAGIIVSSLFDLIVRGYRPSLRDYLRVLTLDAVYVAVILAADLYFGWNYGYLGNATPEGRTFVDVLGPWPQRMFLIIGIAWAMQTLMFLPWLLYRLVGRARTQTERSI